VLGLFLMSGAQTNKWRLIWQPNTEPDIYLYRIFRGTHPHPTTQLDSIQHPAVSYEDRQIKKGVLYYYRIKAVDFSLNASAYSAEISAAIPKISAFPAQMTLVADTTVYLNLNDYVSDPDHADNLLKWNIKGNSHIQVNIDHQNQRAAIHTPAKWNGTENIVFTCTDPDSFSDAVSLTVHVSYSPQAFAPQFSDIPKQIFKEDHTIDVDLKEYVSDRDSPADSLIFTATAGNHLQTQLSGSVLKIIPQANWYGSSTVHLTVSDPARLTDTATVQIEILSVNDAPQVLVLPSIIMKQDTAIKLNTSNWARDIDDADDKLTWTFGNYYHISLDYQAADHLLNIASPADWSGFEYVRATVKDPAGASDWDTLLVRVTDVNFPPKIGDMPHINFNEDDSTALSLDDYVSDPDTPIQNLFWRSSGNKQILVSINPADHVAVFKAQPNWNGKEQFWLKVMDADQQQDSARVTVTVNPVNDPPQLLALPAINLSEQPRRTVDLNPYVVDVDDPVQKLIWTAAGNDHIQITISQSNVARISVNESWYGQESVRFTVKDSSGAEDSGNMTIFRQNLQHAPSISGLDSIHIQEDSQRLLNLSGLATDPDNSAADLSWSFSGNTQIELNYDNQNKTLLIRPNSNWNGREKIAARVEDPDKNFDLDTLTIYVDPVNDPPKLLPIPEINLFGSTVYVMDLKAYIVDNDGLSDIKKIELLGGEQGFIGHFLDQASFQLTFFTPADYTGRETFLLRITDSYGLQSNSVFMVVVRRDNIENKINMAYFGDQTNLRFNWETLEKTKDYIEYGTNKSYGQKSASDQEFSTEHESLLKNLKPNSAYHFRIVSVDERLNTSFSQDSVFITGTPSTQINVFPIPWQASTGQTPQGIYFTNLQPGANIFIYNLAGEPVYRNKATAMIFSWDVRNNAGKAVSSGLYLYVIKDKNNKKIASGKIIVIR